MRSADASPNSEICARTGSSGRPNSVVVKRTNDTAEAIRANAPTKSTVPTAISVIPAPIIHNSGLTGTTAVKLYFATTAAASPGFIIFCVRPR